MTAKPRPPVGIRPILAAVVLVLVLLSAGRVQAASLSLAAQGGITAPQGALFLPGNLGGHWWVADHLAGLCRLDAAPAGSPASAGPLALNAGACGTGNVNATQPVYDPAAQADGTHFVYVGEVAKTGVGVVRHSFNPATETLSNPTTIAPGLGLDGPRPTALALGPDGALYVGFQNSGDIRRVSGPAGPTAAQTVQTIAKNARGKRSLRMGFIGANLWLAEPDTVSALRNAPACASGCQAQASAATINATLLTLATDTGGFVYYSDCDAGPCTLRRFDPVAGQTTTVATSGVLPAGAGSSLQFLSALGVDAAGNLLVGDDPGNGVPSGRGRLWASAVVAANPTPPGAPTGVTATAGNAQATVNWIAPVADGGSPITAYTVNVATVNGVAPVPPVTVSAPATARTATLSGLTNGAAYTFSVTASNAIGAGPASAPSAAVTPSAPITPPGAPTGVTATAGNAQATVAWAAPAGNGGSAITGYTVRVATANGAPPVTPISVSAPATALSATVTGLSNGTTYTLTVTAANATGAGAASAPSNSVTPTAGPVAPGAPTGVSATAGNAQATVSWTAPTANGGSAITSYTVTSIPAGGAATVAAPATTATVAGLTNGTAYTFVVAAANSAGSGPASAPSASVTPIGPPGAPTAVTAVAGNAQAGVSWTAPAANGGSPISAYTVSVATANGVAPTIPIVVTAAAPAATATVTGLTNGTAYTFVVTAANAAGSGPASVPSAAVTPIAPPDPPTAVSASPGLNQATVSWSAPLNNGGSAVTGYVVTASPGGATASVAAPATTATVAGLTGGTTYTFTVTAVNAAGASGPSAPSNPVTPFTPPDPPTGVTAVAGKLQATVSWTPPVNTGGQILSYTVIASPAAGLVAVAAPATSVDVTGLQSNIAYTFTVTATNAAGTSLPSAPSAAVTPFPASADLSVSVTAGPAPSVGAELVYTVTVVNAGPDTANGVFLTDILPPNVTFVSALPPRENCSHLSGVVHCSVGALASGASSSAIITVIPKAAGVFHNNASVTSNDFDPNTTNNVAALDVQVAPASGPATDIAVTGAASTGSPLGGAGYTYTFQVKNNGPAIANGVVFTDALPANLTFVGVVSSVGACLQSSGTVSCDLGALAVGKQATITITVTAPTTAATIVNTASVSFAGTDLNAANSAVAVTVAVK